jgi:hypothetical protein
MLFIENSGILVNELYFFKRLDTCLSDKKEKGTDTTVEQTKLLFQDWTENS